MQRAQGRAWGRTTPWRQGAVIDRETLLAVSLIPEDAPIDEIGVVISHDCDLALDDVDAEPLVELILGRNQPTKDGNLTWAKSTRRLHLEYAKNGAEHVVELNATRRLWINKTDLAEYDPDGSYALSTRQLSVLRDWLSARYRRTAFPDAFVERLSAVDIPRRLAKLLEPSESLLSFVYFSLHGAESVELTSAEAYDLTAVLVYFPGNEPSDAQDAAEQLADKVDSLLRTRLAGRGPSADGAGTSNGIVVKACFAISEDEVTVAQAQTLMRWRLDHMSLKNSSASSEP